MKLTQSQVDALKKLPGYHLDGDRLYLNVRASGSWSWLVFFQLHGKDRGAGLGRCSLDEARKAAAAFRAAAALGVDPIVARAERLAAAKERECSCCKRTLPLSAFRKGRSCLLCISEQHKTWLKENDSRVRAWTQEYNSRPGQKEKDRATSIAWRKKNEKKIKVHENEKRKRWSKDLVDHYIKRDLHLQLGVKFEHITQEVIEARRAHLRVKRLLVEKQSSTQKGN